MTVGDAVPAELTARSFAWPDDPVEILRLLYPRLLAAARMVDGGGAEDLVQETLVETLVRHPGFAGITHPLGYAKVTMFRIAYRSRLRRRAEAPLHLTERLEALADPAGAIAERLRMHDALARLGPRQRACLVLRYLEGLDVDAIAGVLGCTPSTVRSQIARGLRRMRLALDDEEMT